MKIEYILDESESLKNRKEVAESFRQIKRSPEYNASLLKLQVFKGIIDSACCEDELKEEDIVFIEKWIDSNNINDKSFKKFKKEEKDDDVDMNECLMDYSDFLEGYLQ